ncbi:MAG: alpha/beta hydrolase [Candidatus Cyclobacteriaceae bacterium M3_2C_046]
MMMFYWIILKISLFISGFQVSYFQNLPEENDLVVNRLKGNFHQNIQDTTSVVEHLYQIYQKPPPLAKSWPPANLQEWQSQRQHYLKAIHEMLNLPPASKKKEWPLNLRFTRPDLKTDGFTVKYLAYQSRPNLWVTANLYLPNELTKPAPTILMLHGHTDEGKATQYYQVWVQNLVKKGYVVLFKDGFGKGERKHTDHNYGKKAPFTYLSGISIEGLETWDNIRAVDLLSSGGLSQWVDSDRIGVAGKSGGSMQAFYLSIVDDRIKAAAPVTQRNTYTAEFKLWGHCICCVCATNIRRTAEQYHLLATVAPRPVIVCSGTTDRNHPLHGAIKLVEEAKQVYKLYQREDNLQLVIDDVGHDLSLKFRRQIYRFFNYHLDLDANDQEESIVPLTVKQLSCGLPEQSTATVASLVYENSKSLPREKIDLKDRRSFKKYQDKLITKLKNEIFGFDAYMAEKSSLNEKVLQKVKNDNFCIEKVAIDSEPGITLIGDLLYRDKAKNIPVIVSVVEEMPYHYKDAMSYLNNGYAVFYIKPRPDDGFSKRYGENWGVWVRGMSSGKPSAGMKVYDLIRTIDYLETRHELINKERIGLTGVSSTRNAMHALYAAALDQRIKSLVLLNPIISYKPVSADLSDLHQWDLDIYIPQVLLYADVPEVMSLLAPRPMLIKGIKDMANDQISIIKDNEHLEPVTDAYSALNADNLLSILPVSKDYDDVLWFDRTLILK